MVLEGFFVSLAGGAMALLMTSWTAKSFARFIPPNANPIALNGTVDHNVVAAIVLLSYWPASSAAHFPHFALRAYPLPKPSKKNRRVYPADRTIAACSVAWWSRRYPFHWPSS